MARSSVASHETAVLREVQGSRSIKVPSLRARLLNMLLRLLVRPLLLRTTNLPLLRERLRWFDHLLPVRGPQTQPGHLEDIETEYCAAPRLRRVLLYLHGGGFCFRPTRAHSHFLVALATGLDAVAVMPKYRLSPEHPFPAAPDDCVRVYEALLRAGVRPESIVLAGDSAGGNLALSLLMRLRDEKWPLPGCAILISPGTDLAGIGKHGSYSANRHKDALVPPEALPRIVRAYAGHHDCADSRISPLHGDFTGLTPLHIVASRDEVLRDDSRLAAMKATAAGVPVELSLWAGMMHAFPLFQALPEARTARADMVRFARAHAAEHIAGATKLHTTLHEGSPS